ncbi:hypothetical protein Gotri_027088, partial [Gossypium trilobum]|nr:hypothetical protein [Gossypium trilobum]
MKAQDDSNNWFKVICNKTANGKEAPAFTTQIPTTSSGLQVVTSSIVGCPLTIPKGLSSFFANMSDMVDSSDYRRKRSCGFASLISYNSDLTDDFDLSNRTHVPTYLQWGTQISGECYLNDSSDTSCTLDGEYCWSRLSSNHLCSCNRDIADISYSRSCK